MVTFDNIWPLPVAVMVIVAMTALTIWSYRRAEGVSPAIRVLLAAFRMAAVLAIAVCILRPSLKIRETLTEKAGLVLLVDASRSMSIRDEGERSRAQAAAEIMTKNADLIRELAEKFDLQTYRFGAGLSSYADGAYGPVEPSTALGDVLLESARRVRTGRIAGVVLLSDGSNNAGHDPLMAARSLAAMKAPVFAVGLGREQVGAPLTDARARNIDLPETAFKRSTVPVSSELHFLSCEGRRVRVQLFVDDTPVDERYLSPDDADVTAKVTFDFVPIRTGPRKVTVSVDAQPGETVVTNNEISSFIYVLPGGLNVFYAEGKPRYEFKFIRRALADSPDIRLDARLFLSKVDHPKSGDDWKKYDVVILGDLKRDAFSLMQLMEIEQAVSKYGVGLMMIGGSRNFGAGGYAGTPLASLLPVKLQEAERIPGEYRMVPTAEGLRHSALRLEDDPQRNTEAWRSLPALDGQVPFGEPKPAAALLATGNDTAPLLVAQQYGKGRIMAFGADTTWHWAFAEDEEVSARHKRFWRQVILWLANKESLGRPRAWLSLSAVRLVKGDKLDLTAHFEGPDEQPMEDVSVEAAVKRPDNKVVALELSPSEGKFKGTCLPELVGDYEVNVKFTDKEGRELGADSGKFLVYLPETELETPSADPGLLRKIAEVTGGTFCTAEGADELLARLASLDSATRVKRVRLKPIWDRSAVLWIFVAALAVEWALRKRRGMV